MTDYIPDPIELMEMRIEHAIDTYVVGDKMRCCNCQQLFDMVDVMEASADLAAPPICHPCFADVSGMTDSQREEFGFPPRTPEPTSQ